MHSEYCVLNYHGCTTILRKADLPEMSDNDMITRKVHADRNELYPGKEWRLYAQ